MRMRGSPCASATSRSKLPSVLPSSTATTSAGRSSARAPGCSKLGQRHELAVAPVDVVARQRAQALPAEVLDDEGGEHAAEHDGAPEPALRALAGGGQVRSEEHTSE